MEGSLLLGVLTITAVVIAAAVLVVLVRSAGGPRFEATIESIVPTGASQVAVDLQVTNLGGSAAAPTCEVHMSSAASAFTGDGTFEAPRPIAGGSSARYSILVSVTADGATRVGFGASGASCR